MCRLFCIRYVLFFFCSIVVILCVFFVFYSCIFSFCYFAAASVACAIPFHTLIVNVCAVAPNKPCAGNYWKLCSHFPALQFCVYTFEWCGWLAYMYCSMFNVHIKLNVFLLLLSLLLPLMVGCCFCHCRMCYPRSTQKNSTTAYKLNNTAYYAWYVYIYFANVRARFQIHFAHKWLSTKTRQTRQTSHFLSRFCSLFCRLSSDVWSFRFGVYLWLSVGRRRATSLFVILFYFQTTKQNKNDKNTAKKST